LETDNPSILIRFFNPSSKLFSQNFL